MSGPYGLDDLQLGRVPSLDDAARYASLFRQRLVPGVASSRRLASVDELCAAAHVDLERVDLGACENGVQALLAPRRGGRFLLRVDPTPAGGWTAPDALRDHIARHRERFLICHELAHTLFYDRNGDRPRRLVGDSPQQEAWCDRFAADLLVPPQAVRRHAPSPATVLSLAQRYDVSLQLAVRTVAAAHPGSFVALLVRRGRIGPPLRVQWQSHAPTGRWWASDWLQQALDAPRAHGNAQVAGSPVRWQALPERRQVLVTSA
jgi:hypothetical protein